MWVVGAAFWFAVLFLPEMDFDPPEIPRGSATPVIYEPGPAVPTTPPIATPMFDNMNIGYKKQGWWYWICQPSLYFTRWCEDDDYPEFSPGNYSSTNPGAS
jgi:hypothetical protein